MNLVDHRVSDDVFIRKLDREVLEMYELKTAPKCTGPTGIHSAKLGKKAEAVVVRRDGRPLAWACNACAEDVAGIYAEGDARAK